MSCTKGTAGRSNGRTERSFGLQLKQVQVRYEDIEPTLAGEHLASDDGLAVHAETRRRWPKEAGLWQRRRRKPYDSGGKRGRTLARWRSWMEVFTNG